MAASVTKSFTQAILYQLEQQGIELPSELLSQLTQYQTDTRLPMPLQDSLWRYLEAHNRPELGLDIGAAMQPQYFDTMGFLLLSSPSLSVAVNSLVNYSPLIGEGGRFSKSHTQQGWQLCYHSLFTDAVAMRIEAIFASIAVGAGWVVGKKIKPVSVSFTHEQQTDITRYQQVFGSNPIRFKQKHNAIIYSDTDWHTRQRDVNPAIQSQILALARQQLSQLQPQKQSITHEVTTLLTNQPWLTRAQMATSLAVSERTLSRKLNKEGTSYQAVAQSVRKQLALTQAVKPDVTQASLAHYLGYCDESAFSKAFKRWTGLGFREYRRKHIN